MIRITPGSHAAALVASIRPNAKLPSRLVTLSRDEGLTPDLPARFRRPIIMRHAHRGECCERIATTR